MTNIYATTYTLHLALSGTNRKIGDNEGTGKTKRNYCRFYSIKNKKTFRQYFFIFSIDSVFKVTNHAMHSMDNK